MRESSGRNAGMKRAPRTDVPRPPTADRRPLTIGHRPPTPLDPPGAFTGGHPSALTSAGRAILRFAGSRRSGTGRTPGQPRAARNAPPGVCSGRAEPNVVVPVGRVVPVAVGHAAVDGVVVPRAAAIDPIRARCRPTKFSVQAHGGENRRLRRLPGAHRARCCGADSRFHSESLSARRPWMMPRLRAAGSSRA